MQAHDKVRIDRWLWAVRIYKTRSQATEACRKGRITVNGLEAKASREIKPGDQILIRKLPVIYTVRVKDTIEKRLPAKRVHEFLDDLTSPDELVKMKVNDQTFFNREKGTGRPTKKERRQLDQIINQD